MGLERINTLTLLIDLRRVAEELGRPPVILEYEELGNHHDDTIRQRFDSWDDALRAAGLNPADKRDLREKFRIPTEALIDELHAAAFALGRPPTGKEMNETGICSSGVFIRRFGSWSKALRAADLPSQESPRYTKEELLESVIELADELGHMPSTAEYDTHGISTSHTVRNHFESWTEVTAAVRERRIGL